MHHTQKNCDGEKFFANIYREDKILFAKYYLTNGTDEYLSNVNLGLSLTTNYYFIHQIKC